MGGKGIVWKAKADQRFFAVKFLKVKSSQKDKKRFEQERNFCKDNCHDNIVKCIGYGARVCTDKDGNSAQQHYYIMPFYAKTFKDIIREVNNAPTIIGYFYNCAMQSNAFTVREYFKDIKPENILWDESISKIFLDDFGIAQFPKSRLTTSSERLANFIYHAPEQEKESKVKITAAVDLCVGPRFERVLYETYNQWDELQKNKRNKSILSRIRHAYRKHDSTNT
ncbi:MAG: protein kinase [Bacteroidales bacterium]|nr:protein kinase [Bacteroidales bacterium]